MTGLRFTSASRAFGTSESSGTFSVAVVSLLAAFSLSACNLDAVDCVVMNVSISPSAATLTPGATTTLSAGSNSSGCNPVPQTSWISSATSIATVTPAGLVTAVAPGVATITATVDTMSATAVVRVIPPPVSSIDVTVANASMTKGSSQQASAVLRDASNQVISGRVVVWSSSAAGVAAVDATTGMITAVSSGTAIITATSEGRTGTVQIFVVGG